MPKKHYNKEFIEKAVALALSSEKSMAQTADELGIKQTTLYSWVKKAESTAENSESATSKDVLDELKRLKKELAQVKEERDILKKATAYFAKESR